MRLQTFWRKVESWQVSRKFNGWQLTGGYQTHYGINGISYASVKKNAGESEVEMETKLYVGNLSSSTVQNELNTLFAQAGTVLSAKVVKEQKSGESMGFGFVTMSTQFEADKAVSMFNLYLLGGHTLNVSLVKTMENRDVNVPRIEL